MQSVAVLINKLGHEIEEIRVRALNNILMKLSCHVLTTEDLVENHELYIKLINWFKFPICPEKEKVLELIMSLAKTETGRLKFLEIDSRLRFLRDFDITESERKLSKLISNIIFALEYSEQKPDNRSSPNTKERDFIKGNFISSAGTTHHPFSHDRDIVSEEFSATQLPKEKIQFSRDKTNQLSNFNSTGSKYSFEDVNCPRGKENLSAFASASDPKNADIFGSTTRNVAPVHTNYTHEELFSANFRNDEAVCNNFGDGEDLHAKFSNDGPLQRNFTNEEPSHSNLRNKDPIRTNFRNDFTYFRREESSNCNSKTKEPLHCNFSNEKPLHSNYENEIPVYSSSTNQNPVSNLTKDDILWENYRNREASCSNFSNEDSPCNNFKNKDQPNLPNSRASTYSENREQILYNLSGSTNKVKSHGPNKVIRLWSQKSSFSDKKDVASDKQNFTSDKPMFTKSYSKLDSEKLSQNHQNLGVSSKAEPHSTSSARSSTTKKSKSSVEEVPESNTENYTPSAKNNFEKFDCNNFEWRTKNIDSREEQKDRISTVNRDSPLPFQSPASFQLDDADSEVFQICLPKWQTLILSDYHVLSAVSQSLKDPDLVDHSCHFFMTVLIRDFPAPVFIQHSSILKSLLWLLKTKSTSSKAIIACLNRLVSSFLQYSTFIENPGMVSMQSDLQDTSSSASRASPDIGDSSNVDADPHQHQKKNTDQEDLCNVKSEQISIPQLCSLISLHLASHVSEVCGAVHLLRSVLKLFVSHLSCDASELWGSTNLVAIDCCQHLNSFMIDIALAYKTWAGDSFKQLRIAATVCEFLDALVPTSIAKKAVPEILQEILSLALLDPVLIFLYPKLHSFIFQYVQIFQSAEIPVYKELILVKESISAGGLFLQSGLMMPVSDALQIMAEALPSIPFHLKLELIHTFVYFCSHKTISKKEDISLSIDITLKLLASSSNDIRSFMYGECHRLIASKLGVEQAVKSSDPVPHLKFVLNSEVITELVLFGVFDSNDKIQCQAKEILMYVLSSRRLVPKYSFKTILTEIAPVLPLLECLANKNTEFGRCILGLLNPDTSPLSKLQLLTGNLRLMFHNDSMVREEGIARIMWLMRTTTVVEQASEIFIVDKPAHQRQTLIGVYETGSMCRVLELLTAPCVEDRLRRSALIQLSVMTEDWGLHDTFLEQNGLKVILDILKTEIEEPRTDSGRDIVLSIACILKNLVRHNTHTRLKLSNDFEIYRSAFLGLFKYHDELRLRRDCAELLSLLLFAAQILTPTVTCISVVDLVKRSVVLPFDHSCHAKKSPHTEPQLTGLINNENCKKCLSIHWHVVNSNSKNVNSLIENCDDVNSEYLPISEKTIFQLQSASLPFSITQLFYAVQNATDHSTVIEMLDNISRYLEMYWLVSLEELKDIPFKASMERFLTSPPSNSMDQELLVIVLKFISDHSHVLQYHLTWLSGFLADERNALSKLVVSHIGHDNTLTKWKEICIEVFQLSKKCIQLFRTENWTNVTNNIEKCLRFSHTQHFYNLAFLDALLSCFVEITSASPLQPVDSTVLWELISAFHCSNPQSFMGLSVTRNTLILLNHLFHFAVRCKRWEDVWLVENRMMWFPLLFASRDVIVAASAFQLVSGLTSSRRGAEFMLTSVDSLWSISLAVFINHQEASIVRESAAMVCSNIISHGTKELMIERCREIGLFQELSIIVTHLKIWPVVDSSHLHSESVPTDNGDWAPTMPGLLKAACLLVTNLTCLSERTLNDAYHEGFCPALFRFLKSFQVPCVLSCDLITMLTAMCPLLAHTMNKVENILAPNCTVSILPLLNSHLFDGDIALERDALWSELWFFLSTIPSSSNTLINLSPTAVAALLYSLSSSNRNLQMNALVAVRALSPSFNKDIANEVTVSLVALWDRFSHGNKQIALYAALGQLFMDWSETSVCALKNNFSKFVLFRLKKIHVDLSVSAPDVLRSKKKHPDLTELINLLGLLSNFLAGSELVKKSMAENGLAAIFHNLWVWCSLNSNLFQRYLEVLCTFTADSPEVNHSLVSSTVICGKTPRTPSLLHALISLLVNEDSFSTILQSALTVLSHSSQSKPCRLTISKNQILSTFTKIAETKKLSEDYETSWLKFFCVFSSYHEGQISLIQLPNFFESIVQLANHSKQSVRTLALIILMNLAFSHPNQSKLTSSDRVLLMLSNKLDKVSVLSKSELKYIAAIIWVLAANCQKAKLSIKRLSLHRKLQAAASSITDEDVVTLLENITTIFKT